MSHIPNCQQKSIVILGEAGVGKTCFLDMFVNGKHFVNHDATWNDHATPTIQRELLIDGSPWLISVEDLSLTPLLAREEGFRHDIFEGILMNAHGVIFLYDITNESSYDLITKHGYILTYLSRKQATVMGQPFPTGRQRFGCVLVGNKLQLVEEDLGKRQVKKEAAADWASMHAWRHYEVDTSRRGALDEVVRGLVKSIQKAERRDDEDLESSVEDRWKDDRWDMWGEKIEPWGDYKAVEPSSSKRAEEKKESVKEKGPAEQGNSVENKGTEKKGLSKSFSKLRGALPRIRSKTKAPLQRGSK